MPCGLYISAFKHIVHLSWNTALLSGSYWPSSLCLAALLRSSGKALSSHWGRSIYLDITVSILLTSSLISSSTPSIPGKLGLYLIFSLYPLMLEKNEELNMLNVFIRLRHSNNLYSLFQINGSPSYILFSLNHNLPSLRIFRKHSPMITQIP